MYPSRSKAGASTTPTSAHHRTQLFYPKHAAINDVRMCLSLMRSAQSSLQLPSLRGLLFYVPDYPPYVRSLILWAETQLQVDTMSTRPNDTMLAAVLERFGEPYIMKQVHRHPDPEGQDVLVKVLAASYCHTDAVFASGRLSQSLPRVGCHEFAGEIVSLGPDVHAHLALQVGMRVGIPGRAYRPCGTCFECTNSGGDIQGYSPYCPYAGNLGLTEDGGFQEYCFVDSRQLAPIPQGLTAVQTAPLMCAGLTVWAVLQHEKIHGARKVAILGAGGGLGHLAVQFAAHLGKEVLAVDANERSLDILQRIKNNMQSKGEYVHIADARKMDASAMLDNIGEGSSAKAVTECGVDAAILLPESQAAFDLGMKLLRNRGVMVVVSFPETKLHVNASDLVFRHISLVGSLVGRNHQLREMMDFVVRNDISAQVKSFSFHQLNDLVEYSKQGHGGKLVIDMTL